MSRFYHVVPSQLFASHEVEVTVSQHGFRADTFGPASFAISYHTAYRRRRNLNVKCNYLPNFIYLDRTGYSGWSEIASKVFDPDAVDLKLAETYFERKLWSGALEQGASKYA